MTLSDRDRKILAALIPLAVIAAYWFLLLAPKREESTQVKDQLTQVQSERDTAVQKAAGLSAAKRSFARDYATVIYLGKSIPSNVDMPSLLVQLDRAARGTGIKFTSISAGDRTSPEPDAASGAAPGAPNGGSGPASSSTPAQSGPGAAAQGAGNAVDKSNSSSAAAGGSQPQPAGTPPAGQSGAAPSPAAEQTALDTVPLDFEFNGSFFDLADFFHRMKRFVRIANDNIVVRGRLMTVNSFSFDSKDHFPQITATVHATVYLAPKAEGVSAGASPDGPAGGTPPPPGGQTASSSSPTPAATVTP